MKTITFKVGFTQSDKSDLLTFTEKCVDYDEQVVFETKVRSFVLSLKDLVCDVCVTRITCETINDFLTI